MPPHPDTSGPTPTAPAPPSHPLPDLALAFLKLGLLGFGGPAAHLALMEDEFVRRRQWLSRERFLDLVGAANLIPGPNSTEVALHLGLLRAGLPGLLTAGVCFILPAWAIVTALAVLYTRFGELPTAVAVLRGVTPVVLAIIAQALWKLGRTALKSPALALLAAASALAAWFGVGELAVLAGAALVALALRRGPSTPAAKGLPPTPAMLPALLTGAAGAAGFSMPTLFLSFLKIGSVLFGSGYVLIAFLRSEFIVNRPWLTEQQLLDAVAVGQVTPGPVFTTATFIGCVLGGVRGGVVATVGIFLPAFVFVALSAPLLPRLRTNATAAALLDGVNAASLALMAVAAVQLARGSLTDPWAVVLALAAAGLLLARVNATWIILAAVLLSLARF